MTANSDEQEFQHQLKLEEEERRRQENSQHGKDPYTYVDPNDGTVYEWDSQKQAWFPKIDDDFIAAYQANYGVSYSETSESSQTPAMTTVTQVQSTSKPTVGSTEKSKQTQPPAAGEKRKASEPGWFEVDEEHNTNVYVTGLPLDITEEEFVEVMSKCGLIMKDPDTGLFKIKLYKNPDGTYKGDGLCCYIKIESVDLALKILDGYRLRNNELHVERARFQLKGAYDPSKKPKKKKNKDKEKLKKKIEKLFDWRPDKLRGMRMKYESTVVIKNMFEPKEFENDASLILEYQKDVREECSKFGEVKKVVVYDRNPEGVVTVTFKEPEEADECIAIMNGRWFAGRQLTAETWDGRTKYKIVETEEELVKRLKKWEEYLEGEDGSKEKKEETKTSTSTEKYKTVNLDECPATDSSGESDDENVNASTTKGKT